MKYVVFFMAIGFVVSAAFMGAGMSIMSDTAEKVLKEDGESIFGSKSDSFVEQVRAQEMRDRWEKMGENSHQFNE